MPILAQNCDAISRQKIGKIWTKSAINFPDKIQNKNIRSLFNQRYSKMIQSKFFAKLFEKIFTKLFEKIFTKLFRKIVTKLFEKIFTKLFEKIICKLEKWPTYFKSFFSKIINYLISPN